MDFEIMYSYCKICLFQNGNTFLSLPQTDPMNNNGSTGNSLPYSSAPVYGYQMQQQHHPGHHPMPGTNTSTSSDGGGGGADRSLNTSAHSPSVSMDFRYG